MKKVLGIVGSPRKKGNTHILVSRILSGAEEAGAAVDLLMLGEKKILECDGCHACWRGKGCSKKDDMLAIYPRIVESDALVFGTPVYWYGPTALMKGLIDRFVYFNCPENREGMRGKAAAIAVPFEETGEETADLVVELFRRSFAYLGLELVGRVLAPGVTRRGEVAAQPARLAEAYELGRRLARDDQSRLV
jgi:multimeric flavodoxin WrbA